MEQLKGDAKSESGKLHLKVLEVLVLNDEAADIALLNGRLQQTLNDILCLFVPQNLTPSDIDYLQLTLRVMSLLIPKAESQRLFAAYSTRPVTQLLNIMAETKNKELVANGFSCINQALQQDLVLLRLQNEYSGFKERVENLGALFGREEYIQNERQQIIKRLDRHVKYASLGELQKNTLQSNYN